MNEKLCLLSVPEYESELSGYIEKLGYRVTDRDDGEQCPDLFVYSMGRPVYSPILETEEDDFHARNHGYITDAYFFMVNAFKAMSAGKVGGSVVFIISNMREFTRIGYAAYGSLSDALAKLIKYGALEGARYGIRVNAIAVPIDDSLDECPTHSKPSPSEIADWIANLASSSSADGIIVTLDGGESLIDNKPYKYGF